jgi:hypothetical protein
MDKFLAWGKHARSSIFHYKIGNFERRKGHARSRHDDAAKDGDVRNPATIGCVGVECYRPERWRGGSHAG